MTWNEHVSWTAMVPGAAWIWDEYLETNPEGDEKHSISRRVILPEGATDVSAQLEMAAENSYEVYVNDTLEGADATEYNYYAPTDLWDLSGAVSQGDNIIRFDIHNWAMAGGTAYTNPGGLLYCVTLSYTL